MKIQRRSSPGLVAGLILALGATSALAGELSLTGEGSVRYEPDSANLQFTANAEAATTTEAAKQVHNTIAQWRQQTEKWRSQFQDYSDARLSLYTRTRPPVERNDEPKQVAVANQTVSFSIQDLELLNPILEKAQSLGLEYHLSPNQFFHSNPHSLEQEALRKAIADARRQCEFVASQLNQKCGDVVTMTVNGGFRPMPLMMAESRAAKDTVGSVGPQEIKASVSATFKLE
ncbi:hypothetical protein MSNKSG1_08468 [Marinobacter santoriniensis NKSG1]|uniref:Periplasmic/secreted protein n=1 Tax=Marinobacter santoriniensis NKSG1 TaxID=1288826 RepID=M7CQG3_9GAMM|nr:SIMPL domain-containing protein [Marinobacter santoriniensis]EMP55891.1 hypothetical protein MSNKSG1_08468 [Marinobacter santoriniensis NKSG1]